MSERPEAGRSGGNNAGLGGRGGRGNGNNRRFNNEKKAQFKNTIEGMTPTNIYTTQGGVRAIPKFDDTKEEHIGLIRMKGKEQCSNLANAMETLTQPTIEYPVEPPQNIEDPNNAGQQIANPNLVRDA